MSKQTLATTQNIDTTITSREYVPQITLRPIQSIDTIVDAYNEYNRLKERLLNSNDYQVIKGKSCIKKSGFRKLACAFGISTEITYENRINLETCFVYEVTCRAIAPNGRYVEACASCSSIEKDFAHLENDVRATAQTRASNRAISDLIGGGEVSAEELSESPQSNTQYKENKNPVSAMAQEELENSEPHMKGIVHKNNTSYETQELMTIKQKQYLIKLIEIKYPDEQTRSKLYNRLLSLTKIEARNAIQKMLAY